ncbi:MAG: hypothetical protein GX561_03605 [Lentisphaerae bacterium]|jgi:peptidyl-prolyl cis-trans isomerase C|nr:hypothetical protein [Lentisphaerota bacterium]
MPELNFNIPKPQTGGQSSSRLLKAIGFFAVLELVLLLGILISLNTRKPVATLNQKPYDSAKGRDTAQHLERIGLFNASANAWHEYLDKTPLDNEEQARILFRIGTIRQQAGDYENAVLEYINSSKTAKLDDLDDDITRRIDECLRTIGKFVGANESLAKRTSINGAPSDDVLAEIGPWKITKNEIDSMLEALAERQLGSQSGNFLDENQKKHREAVLKQMTSPENRQRFLQEFITTELLVREARQLKLHESDAVRKELMEAERMILASTLMKQKFAAIQITDSDLKNYYAGNQEAFAIPEAVKLAHIQLKDEKQANEILTEVTAGKDFAELAKAKSGDKATASQAGTINQWLEPQQASGWQQTLVDAAKDLPKNAVVPNVLKSDKGFHIVKVIDKRERSIKPFDDSTKREAHQKLLQEKRMEIQSMLFRELFDKYRVVLHTPSQQ